MLHKFLNPVAGGLGELSKSAAITLVFIGICAGFDIPNPAIVCILAVVVSIFLYGNAGGSVSGVLTLGYCGYYFSAYNYTAINLYKMVIIFAATAAMFFIVSTLKNRSESKSRELLQKTEEEQRMRKLYYAELERAANEQQAMLPADIKHPKLRLCKVYEPALLVSGDFFGYQWLVKDERFFGYLLDMKGHGAATALQIAALKVMISELLQPEVVLPELVSELHDRVKTYFNEDILIAASFFVIDFPNRELNYIAAGITEFYIQSAARKERIKTPGSFLGIYGQPEHNLLNFSLQSGDLLCFYTDGIADRIAGQTVPPDFSDFHEFVQTVRTFAAKGARRDDASALCIKIGQV